MGKHGKNGRPSRASRRRSKNYQGNQYSKKLETGVVIDIEHDDPAESSIQQQDVVVEPGHHEVEEVDVSASGKK